MPHLEKSSYSFPTLAQWMKAHNGHFDDVVETLCGIFDISDVKEAAVFVEEEIDHQGRIMLVLDGPEIMAVAGWCWTRRGSHIAAYAGVRPDVNDPYLREELIAEIITRLERERIMTERVAMKFLLIQYSPLDRLMGRACLDLNGQRHPERNSYFKNHLGTRWTLRSMMFPFTIGPIPA